MFALVLPDRVHGAVRSGAEMTCSIERSIMNVDLADGFDHQPRGDRPGGRATQSVRHGEDVCTRKRGILVLGSVWTGIRPNAPNERKRHAPDRTRAPERAVSRFPGRGETSSFSHNRG